MVFIFFHRKKDEDIGACVKCINAKTLIQYNTHSMLSVAMQLFKHNIPYYTMQEHEYEWDKALASKVDVRMGAIPHPKIMAGIYYVSTLLTGKSSSSVADTPKLGLCGMIWYGFHRRLLCEIA